MDLPRPGRRAAAVAAALSFDGSSSDDAAWRAPSGLNAVSKNGLRGPEGFALWTRAAIVLKGESWERAPGVLLGESSPLDFFAAGDVGGDVGSSIRAAITAASNGVLDSAESLSPEEVVGLAGAASLAGSVLDMVSLGYIRQGSSRLFVALDWEVASNLAYFWGPRPLAFAL